MLASTMVTSGVNCGFVVSETEVAGSACGTDDETVGCWLPDGPVAGSFFVVDLRLGGMLRSWMAGWISMWSDWLLRYVVLRCLNE